MEIEIRRHFVVVHLRCWRLYQVFVVCFCCHQMILKHGTLRASRKSRFCSDSCSCRSSGSRRSCPSLATVWSIFLRWDSVITLNSWILLLSKSASTSCLWISILTSAFALFVFQRESWFYRSRFRDLITVFGTNEVRAWVSPYLCVRKKGWAGNKLSSWE